MCDEYLGLLDGWELGVGSMYRQCQGHAAEGRGVAYARVAYSHLERRSGAHDAAARIEEVEFVAPRMSPNVEVGTPVR